MDDETYAIRAVSGGWFVGYQDEAETEYLTNPFGATHGDRWSLFRREARVYPSLTQAVTALARVVAQENRT